MKENSREEDITRIKQRIEDVKEYIEYGLPYSEYLDLENSFDNILSDYKRVLKENERYKKSDYETICLENNELREITDRIQSEYNDLLKDNFKLKNELETKRKEYQETYKDVREELRELRKENEELKNGTRRNENELEVGIDCDWDALKKALDEAEKTNEYIIYDNEKWIKEKYCVLIQKIKDKIEQYKKILLNCNCFSDVDRIKAINERILELQNLLKNNKN